MWAAAIVILFVLLTVNFEVIMRYVVGHSTIWVVNTTEFALLFIVFLSAPYILLLERHVKIEFAVHALSPGGQRILNTATSLVGALACGVLFWYSVAVLWQAYERETLFEAVMIVRKYWIIWVIPVGSLFLTVQFLRRAWSYATRQVSSVTAQTGV